jgi:hypothetical protein
MVRFSTTARSALRVLPALALALCLARETAAASAAETGPAVASADAFVDAIGVDSHFNYRDSPYVLEWPALSAALIGSGIRHIRDGGSPASDYIARLATLGEHGIKHGAGFSIKATPEIIRQHIAAFAPYLEDVESPNEYDSAKDPDWVANLIAFQKMLYEIVHSDPADAGIKVLGPPLAHQQFYAQLGPLDAYEDAANLHITTCDLNPGTDDQRRGSIPYTHSLLRMSTLVKPIWTTETGYNDDMQRPCALADETIAKYDLRTIAEKWNAGEQRVYLYQFADMPSDRIFGGLGLMRADATPKPQFKALESMIHLLADPGPPFDARPLKYGLGGDSANVHRTLLQKRDGRYELLLWLEVRSWDPKSRTAIDVQPQTVTLSLPAGIASGKLYAFTPDWTLASTPLQLHGGTASIRVTDAISVVELSP